MKQLRRIFEASALSFVLSIGLSHAQGPIAWWQFDEADGALASDSSGNGHDGALVGGASFDPVGGKFGGALVLDGASGLVEVPDADDLEFPQGQDFTISAFFNSGGAASDNNNGLVTKGYGDNPRSPTGYYLLQINNASVFELDSRCCEGATPRFRTGTIGPGMNDGSWHQVAVVRDYAANEIRSYVDGTLQHTQLMNAADGGDWDMGVNTETLQIGDHLNRFTTGLIDDVALWDRALSEQEIADVFASGAVATSASVAISFRGSPSPVLLSEPVTLQWRVAVGATVSIDQGVGEVTAMTDGEGNGSVEVIPTEETTYTLTASKGGAPELLQATARIKLIDSFASSETAISSGQSVTLSWTVAPAATVTIDQGVGGVGAQTVDGVGSIDFSPASSATFTLTASHNGTDETAEVTVNIVDTSDGPVAYWPFDEANGTTAADLSGSLNEHPAELQPGATFEPAGGRFGGAVCLDGASGEVRAADHEDYEFLQGQDFSITLFFNSGGVTSDTNNGLVSKGYADNPRSPDGYYLLQVTNPSQFELDSRCCAGGTPRFRTGLVGPSITDGNWHNVTVVRDYGSNEIRTYIDAALEHTQVMNDSTGGDWNMGVNTEDLVIGDHLDRFTTGKIDDVAIWRRPLTEAEITNIVANGVASTLQQVKLPFSVEASPGNMLTLRWESKGGKLYNVRSVVDPSNADPIDWPVFDGNENMTASPPENVLTFVRPADTERFFIVEEFNAPPVSAFSDDFESGAPGWTMGNDGAAGTDWQLGAPTNGPGVANSLTNCFATNLDSDYALEANVWLRSPAIDLTGAGGATLNYANYVDVEGQTFDFGIVAVLDAANDSVLATLIDPVDSLSGGWVEVSKSLPAEALGKEIKIEFRLISDDFDGSNFPGWFLDDFEVTVP